MTHHSSAFLDLIIEHIEMCWIIQSDGLASAEQLTSYREKHRYRLRRVSETGLGLARATWAIENDIVPSLVH